MVCVTHAVARIYSCGVGVSHAHGLTQIAGSPTRLGNCVFQRGYFLSLFFFLDLLATLSLMVDVDFIRDAIFSQEDYVSLILQTCTPDFQLESSFGTSP